MISYSETCKSDVSAINAIIIVVIIIINISMCILFYAEFGGINIIYINPELFLARPYTLN